MIRRCCSLSRWGSELCKMLLHVISKNICINPSWIRHHAVSSWWWIFHEVRNKPFSCKDKEWRNSYTTCRATSNYCTCMSFLWNNWWLMKVGASNNSRWSMILHNTFLINIKDQVGFVPKVVFVYNKFKFLEVCIHYRCRSWLSSTFSNSLGYNTLSCGQRFANLLNQFNVKGFSFVRFRSCMA